MSADSGKKGPVFEGLEPEGDRLTVFMEAVLRHWNGAVTGAAMKLSADEAAEVITICAQGVASFEDASKEVPPAQKVLVGVEYTINALRQWRERGMGWGKDEG